MLIIASLIFFGILFLLIEFLFTAGFGVAGILGLGSLAGACVYAFLEMSTLAGIVVTACVIVLVVVCIVIILRSKTWKKMELNTEIDSQVNLESRNVSAGDRGVAMTRLAPMGTAKFGSVSLEVKSFDNKMIDSGSEIEVVDITDNKVNVKTI